MAYILLFIAIFKKEIRISLRYWFNTLSTMIIMTVIFMILYYMPGAVSGMPLNYERGNAIIIGYIIWVFTLISFQSLPDSVVEESRTGTLEQVYMSPFGIEIIFILNLFVVFIQSIILTMILSSIITFITGRLSLLLDFVKVFPIAFLLVICVWGIGFILTGIALVFKKLESLYNLVQFLLAGFIILSAKDLFFLPILPICYQSRMIFYVLNRNYSLLAFPLTDWIIVVINSLLYFLLGFYVYKLCEKVAMKKALIGHY